MAWAAAALINIRPQIWNGHRRILKTNREPDKHHTILTTAGRGVDARNSPRHGPVITIEICLAGRAENPCDPRNEKSWESALI